MRMYLPNCYSIILSVDHGLYEVAVFWFSENLDLYFGGARTTSLTKEEIIENMDYVGELREMIKKDGNMTCKLCNKHIDRDVRIDGMGNTFHAACALELNRELGESLEDDEGAE